MKTSYTALTRVHLTLAHFYVERGDMAIFDSANKKHPLTITRNGAIMKTTDTMTQLGLNALVRANMFMVNNTASSSAPAASPTPRVVAAVATVTNPVEAPVTSEDELNKTRAAEQAALDAAIAAKAAAADDTASEPTTDEPEPTGEGAPESASDESTSSAPDTEGTTGIAGPQGAAGPVDGDVEDDTDDAGDEDEGEDDDVSTDEDDVTAEAPDVVETPTDPVNAVNPSPKSNKGKGKNKKNRH
jgi:hypothetical protein